MSEPSPADLGAGRVLLAPVGESYGDQFGNSAASAGDVNGDGYADAIVGAWASDAGAGDKGSAYIYYGGPGSDGIPDVTLRGEAFLDNFGTSVASAGDVNADGFGDVIVGAWLSSGTGSGTGRAYVFYGGSGMNATADLVLVGEAAGDQFGISVSSAGDANADGFSDVIVGASANDAGGFNAGRAYVYFGGLAPNATADLVLTGAAAGDAFGYSVSPAGDTNADGFADFVVGAYGSGGTGRAYVYYGGPGLDGVADRTFTGAEPGDNFGLSVAAGGDVNGDGDDDLIIGGVRSDAAGADAGRAYVYFGGGPGDEVADLIFTGATAGDNFGVSVSSAGDMDGDGFDDLIVGAWLNDAGGSNAGRAYIYFGGPGADASADMILTGEVAGDRFGLSVAPAGDMNADGAAEVIIGAYFNDFGGADAGRAYVVTSGLPRAPAVLAPAIVSGNAGALISFQVTASDGDGDPITSFTAAPLPSGASFTTSASFTSGTFGWTPTSTQGGSHAVTFTAANDLSGSASTSVVVSTVNRAPTLDPIADMSLSEGATVDQALHGSDPDGDALTFTLASGPGFVSVTTLNPTSGNLRAAPGFNDAGSYQATVRAGDGNGGIATRSLALAVTSANGPPVLSVPTGVFAAEGVLISLPIAATDPDGDHVTIGALNRPVGALFVDYGNNSGNFAWTPGFGQMGTYTIRFTGRDDLGADAVPRDLVIVVDDVNRAPVAIPGGPYPGVVNVPITFNGTGSADPDGSPLSYLWNFGDLATATGPIPLHSYAAGGTFVVTLTVGDGSLTHSASTTATIQDVFPARAFATNSNGTIKLGSGKATWCAQIEPVDGSFLSTSAVPSTIVMKYGADQIFADAGKVTIGSDRDRNGVQELTTCFAKADLRALFGGLPNGTSAVTVTLEADLSTGGRFRAGLTVEVVSSGGALAASLSPNPLQTEATLSFRTTRPGTVSVSIFDLQGRLVRKVAPGTDLNAGYHDFRLGARNEHGEALPSGVYFFRIVAPEGTETGRFVIAK